MKCPHDLVTCKKINLHKNTIINKIIKIIFIYFQIWRVEMRNFVKKGICIFTPALLLSACGGGGSFNLDMVESAKPQPNQPKPEPKYQDEATKKRKTEDLNAMQEPELGFAMQIKRRNNHPSNKEEHVPLLAEDIIKLNGETELDNFKQREEVQKKNGEEIHSFDFSNGKSRATGYTDFKYVRLGYFFKNAFRELDSSKNIYKNGPFGYVFYKGINPSQSLPATGTAEYKGTWAYMTDAKNRQQFPGIGSGAAANQHSALSHNEEGVLYNENEAKAGQTDFGLTSEFTVDFANKTMEGQLYRNNRINDNTANIPPKTKRYDLSATLHGNRFRGKAIATDKSASDHPFTADSDSMEGGFYGDSGEELAGKFLSNDKKVFAVFGAKQKDGTTNTNVQAILDSYKIDKNGSNFIQSKLVNFGNIKKLIVDGIEIPLDGNHVEKNGFKATVCCDNLEYIKFGTFGKTEENSMFLSGERTPLSDIPVEDKEALYRGSWFGHIVNGTSWTTDTNMANNQAEFKVNFGKQTLTGELKAKDRMQPVFTIDATIKGNGFSGMAKTADQGFTLDPKNQLNSQNTKIHAPVNGGFYGNNASELGGSFHGNSLTGESGAVSAVFGAKRQQLVK